MTRGFYGGTETKSKRGKLLSRLAGLGHEVGKVAVSLQTFDTRLGWWHPQGIALIRSMVGDLSATLDDLEAVDGERP